MPSAGRAAAPLSSSGDAASSGLLGLVFPLKYGPGISHNLCTKVRRERDEICSMTGSWDVLSAGMMERSPGKQRLARSLEGGEDAVKECGDPSRRHNPLPGELQAGVCSPQCPLEGAQRASKQGWARMWGPGQEKCRIQGGKVMLGKATHTKKQHQPLGTSTSP